MSHFSNARKSKTEAIVLLANRSRNQNFEPKDCNAKELYSLNRIRLSMKMYYVYFCSVKTRF